MIFICEPTCKSFSHEKINEGFLCKTRLAFPNEKIIFLGHKSHIQVLQKNLKDSNINIDNIYFEKIIINPNHSITGLLANYIILRKIKKFINNNNKSKLLFLSHPKTLLFILKYLNFKLNINKVFIQHAEFETILKPIKPNLKLDNIPPVPFYQKIRKVSLLTIINLIFKKFLTLDPIHFSLQKINYRKILERNHDSSFRYILISKHIIKNIKDVFDIKKQNIYTVYYPQITNISKALSNQNNKFPKFAVFGYGDSKVLFNLNNQIRKREISQPFEIRIIGMDNRGIDQFPWVTCPSMGKKLTRAEMEKLIIDIDYFLILYTNDKYRLSCSGSVIEAISYGKPIIHLKNDCISHFNNHLRIGYEEVDIESLADRIKFISENYRQELKSINYFKSNINDKRKIISPEYELEEFKNIFN